MLKELNKDTEAWKIGTDPNKYIMFYFFILETHNVGDVITIEKVTTLYGKGGKSTTKQIIQVLNAFGLIEINDKKIKLLKDVDEISIMNYIQVLTEDKKLNFNKKETKKLWYTFLVVFAYGKGYITEEELYTIEARKGALNERFKNF